MYEDILRTAPIWTSTGAAVLSAALTFSESTAGPASLVSLAAGACGAAGDLVAYLLKRFVFKPMYDATGKTVLPILGQGPRPAGARNCGGWLRHSGSSKDKGHLVSYGMPSGHSAHMWAMLAFVLDVMLASSAELSSTWWWAAAFLAVITVAVSWSRVNMGCHTWGQVFWGAGLGCALGSAAAAVLTPLNI